MTYFESYMKLASIEEIEEEARRDVYIATLFLGENEDRINAINESIKKAIRCKDFDYERAVEQLEHKKLYDRFDTINQKYKELKEKMENE